MQDHCAAAPPNPQGTREGCPYYTTDAAFVVPVARMQRWLARGGRVFLPSRMALTTLVLILALFFLGDLFRSAHTSAQAGRSVSLFALSDWFRPAQPLPQASSFTFSSPLELTGHPPSPVFFQADAEPDTARQRQPWDLREAAGR